jgi:hypothetical protein
MYRRLIIFGLAALLTIGLFLGFNRWRVDAARASAIDRPRSLSTLGQRSEDEPAPAPAIEPYVRPAFARQMQMLRPVILEAAKRHNRPALSGMSDYDFAVVIALVLYNENFGSLEDRVPSLRPLTPYYQDAQIGLNELGGVDFSIWPSNLRPSVALEILRRQVPVPSPTSVITEPIVVTGSRVNPNEYSSQDELYAALTREIANPHLSIEYLAANLERGLYRARFERVPVTWRTLAAWHNQGIVAPRDISANPTASDYLRRTSAYLATARALVARPDCSIVHCKFTQRSSGPS